MEWEGLHQIKANKTHVLNQIPPRQYNKHNQVQQQRSFLGEIDKDRTLGALEVWEGGLTSTSPPFF